MWGETEDMKQHLVFAEASTSINGKLTKEIVKGPTVCNIMMKMGYTSGEFRSVVSVARNKYKIEMDTPQLREEVISARSFTFRSTTLTFATPKLPLKTLMVFGCPLSLPNITLLTQLDKYLEDAIRVTHGTYRDHPEVRNGNRTVKYRSLKTEIPSEIMIGQNKIQLRHPGERLRQMKCFRCGSLDHLIADCPQTNLCETCGEEGHFAGQCKAQLCEICGEVGHEAPLCPQQISQDSSQSPPNKKINQRPSPTNDPEKQC